MAAILIDEAGRTTSRTETPATLVWIDTDDAVIVRWDGSATIERFASEVPPHHRSTGRVRHDPDVRHGGGGPPSDRIERDREDRLDRFVKRVAERVPVADRVRVIGPGIVRRRLRRAVLAEDRRLGHTRVVESRAAAPRTGRQLVADVRALAGVPAPRRHTREQPG